MATSTTVHGTCDDRFLAVKTRLEEHLASGRDLGASICVNVNGTNVVDIWGGYADAAKAREWEKDTIVNVWSTSKTIASLAVLILIDRGLVDPEEKVSKYWPEFGVNGKEDVKVWHFLSHSSGVSGWAERVSLEDVCDVEKSTKMLEQQAPFFPPGSSSGYHSLTMGHLIGGLVSRVTGKSLGQFITDELSTPLSADFQLGAKEADLPRVADIIPPPPMGDGSNPIAEGFKDPTSVMFRTLTNPPMDATVVHTPVWRGAEIGAANGHSNARGVVRMLTPITLSGTPSDPKILSPATVSKIFVPRIESTDLVLAKPVRFGLGYGIATDNAFQSWMPSGRVGMWGGWGGSMAIVDVDRGVTFSYVMNRMENGVTDVETEKTGRRERFKEYVEKVWGALEKDGVAP